MVERDNEELLTVDSILNLPFIDSAGLYFTRLLTGMKETGRILAVRCPECKRTFYARDGFGGIEDMGRHLRLIHSWDRASLVKYGEVVGIDFDAIYSNIEKEYEFDGSAVGEAPEEAPEGGIEEVGEFDCECGWKPKPSAKKPGFALMMHKRNHPEPVPA